jgi:hypothetical protein
LILDERNFPARVADAGCDLVLGPSWASVL